MSHPPYLVATQLSYELGADRTLFQGVSLSLESGDRIALVGNNGVGKSTLLKILAGQLAPTRGTVSRQATLYYLPQVSTLAPGAETVLDFLSEQSSTWWDILSLMETTFGTTLDLTLPLTALSGGELTKLLLAVGLHQSPEVLLLDEPTNHLDYLALEDLRQALDQFEGAIILVSHKPFFLDQVTHTTWELSPTGLSVYGGSFSHYREQKEIALEASLRAHTVARQQLKRAKTAAVQEQQRAAHSQKSGRQKFISGSIDKLAAGGLKRKAEATAGRLKQKHEKAVAAATQKVDDTKVKTAKATLIQLDGPSAQRHHLVNVAGASLWAADHCLLEQVQFHLAGGDRLALAGANGSGKSSLAQALLGLSDQVYLQGGQVELASGLKSMYLNQRYEVVRRDRTVLENMRAANPNLSYQLHRQQLGHFLFRHGDVHKPAAGLSGGELARLAIAMITVSSLELLVLDEPTNNLDTATVDQLVEALNDYPGALWVISHDLDFLSRIGVTHSYQVVDRALKQTRHLPTEADLYYKELLQGIASVLRVG